MSYKPLFVNRHFMFPYSRAGIAAQAGSVSWSSVSGAPPQLPAGCASGQGAKWNGGAWVCSTPLVWLGIPPIPQSPATG